MKALMLAAGIGRRLYGDDNYEPPKALLRFDGKTLLQRHIEFLQEFGVDELVLIVGHRRDDLLAEADAHAPEGFVRSIFNPRFEEGPILSLWTGAPVLREGDDVLFMDADVLYHPIVLERLVKSPHDTCFIYDRNLEPGEDPVKLCIRDGIAVDFGKRVTEAHDVAGEWPGFFRMSPDIAAKIADRTDRFVEDGELEVNYEEAFCHVLKNEPPGRFGCEHITGLPWIERDFPSDLIRAENIILPRLAETFAEPAGAPEIRERASGD